ncbi:MAG: cyclic pyranopterin monophosphate synthase MoaC [Alphaproteobacteria bacterium]|uniref:cyclic pyranopterin monophosphate synthase MoaC n=1 Tax=Brevundimonas sp. TaxID=1871086 RepID=UPI0012097FB7|nr:cyclic pyranopterin monophosphate synthase MoaC [Brevundimonas sp.]MBU3971556.1 cyclic pyranopterin monophosphate synthase MoaC [Alphaproteobacteria bacterium]MBA3048325.1 cyclic pyranopterin monophosphate synthase MoaC [Brevundimonas sp.]MBU3974928.1 cyclic pyranopterin monophosphate synthase MoaC [Alphaproteobacteria bacterium]MBU4039911.1 cyclic pyranopterin monophosphate synthase MoaC [Alphaproteobacteria bacterium]MBU4137376.1 cyclic pyranopterin monophosphate synthase MoaC [Alphaprote
MSALTHLDAAGRVHMVDVGDKSATARRAVAEGRVICAPATLGLVRDGQAPKGAVITTAELAGIMGAKRTADLIPLCHPLGLDKVSVTIALDDGLPGFIVTAEARVSGPTGVEMEALTAVSVACLTLYDMLKAADRGMVISQVRLLSKSGGRSGDWFAGDGSAT